MKNMCNKQCKIHPGRAITLLRMKCIKSQIISSNWIISPPCHDTLPRHHIFPFPLLWSSVTAPVEAHSLLLKLDFHASFFLFPLSLCYLLGHSSPSSLFGSLCTTIWYFILTHSFSLSQRVTDVHSASPVKTVWVFYIHGLFIGYS